MVFSGSDRQATQQQQLMMLQQSNPLPAQHQYQAGGQGPGQGNQQTGGIRPYFKTPEGTFWLSHEKQHMSGLIQYSHQRTPTKITLATIDDKPGRQSGSDTVPSGASTPLSTNSTSTSSTSSSGSRFSARGLLGSASVGSRGLGFGIGTTGRLSSKGQSQASGPSPGIAVPSSSSDKGQAIGNGPGASSGGEGDREEKASYAVFNVGETLYFADCSTVEKEPLKSLHFNGSQGIHHAFDPTSKEGHDLIIATCSGEVYTVSLRQQLQDNSKRLVNPTVYNKDGSVTQSRCTGVAWVPNSDGQFVTAHADGNLFVYDKGREGTGEVTFPAIKDPAVFSVERPRSSKSNPVARWHVCSSPITALCFSSDGSHCAVTSRDGYLRVLDWDKQSLEGGCRSYFGALLCCAFSEDGKLVVAGGEDDLVLVWDTQENSTVGWCEGHSSWVSHVAFDWAWSPPPSPEDPSQTSHAYRVASVAQDTKLILWEISMDELATVPASRTVSTTSSAAPLQQEFAPQNSSQQSQPESQSQQSPQSQGRQQSTNPPNQMAPGRSFLQPRNLFRPSDAAVSGLSNGPEAGSEFNGPPDASGSAPEKGGGKMFPGRFPSPGFSREAGVLRHAPSRNEVPRVPPLVTHKVHVEPLSSVAFSKQWLATACQDGSVKFWLRPGVPPLMGSVAAQETFVANNKGKGKKTNSNNQRNHT